MSLYGNYTVRISKANARDQLKALIRSDARFQRIPTHEDAEQIAAELMQGRGFYVRPSFLYDVWVECMKS